MSAITPLTRDHVDVAATTIARALATDPLVESVLPDPAPRIERTRRFFRIPAEYGLRWGG